jgi:hypothetical protein
MLFNTKYLFSANKHPWLACPQRLNDRLCVIDCNSTEVGQKRVPVKGNLFRGDIMTRAEQKVVSLASGTKRILNFANNDFTL